jgi:hypothetical protein
MPADCGGCRASHRGARRGFQSNGPELEAAPGLNYKNGSNGGLKSSKI